MSDEKPVFVYRLSRTPRVRNLVLFAIAFTLLALILHSIYAYATFTALFIVLALVQYYAIDRRLHSWRIELYEEHYRIFFQGELTQDTLYSDIDRLESRRVRFRRFYYMYGKRDNRILAVIQSSNRRYSELGGKTLVDWIGARLTKSA